MDKKKNLRDKLKSSSRHIVSKIAQLPVKMKIFMGTVATLVVVIIILLCCLGTGKEEVIYVETTAEVGNLTVGITESGNVEVEEEVQTFDIDIDEFAGDSSSGLSWQSAGGGMGGLQDMGMLFGGSTTANTRELIVEEVFVSVGQEITAGTPICSFSQESLSEIQNGLVEDEAAAGNTLKERETDLEVSGLSASQELEQNLLYGELAELEYNVTVAELDAKLKESQDTLETEKEALAENEEKLTQKQEELSLAMEVLANAEFILEEYPVRTSLEGWIQAENNRSTAESTVESLEKEVESLEETVESARKKVTNLENETVTAKKQNETGKIEAKALYDTRILKYESAQEIYDTAIAKSTLNYEIASDEYEEAKEKLDDFTAVIVDNNLIASSDGVISKVSVEVGDSIRQDSEIITYNAYEEVSVTITLEEADREKIELGSVANVAVAALDDELFAGKVTEIGDAVYDNDSGVNTYEVTVSLSGNLERVFDGMSVEITLITKEQKEVLHIPNRAVIRDGAKSYVKVKTASGEIKKAEITTGFSDGINVEILEGLSEGDIVLVESKVSGS